MSATPRARDYGRLYLPGRAASMNRLSSHALEHWFYSKDNRGFREDFKGDAINLDLFAVDGDSGTTVFAQRVSDSGGTYVRGVTATDDDEGIIIYTAAHYLGDKDCGMEVAFKVSSAANLHLEIGFADVLTDKTLGAINDIDTPTVTNDITDGAFVCMDTDQTLTTMALVGVDSGGDVEKSNISTLAPTADTLMVVRLQLIGNSAICVVDDNYKDYSTSLASALEGGTMVFAYAYFQNRAASASKNVDIDWFETWGDR